MRKTSITRRTRKSIPDFKGLISNPITRSFLTKESLQRPFVKFLEESERDTFFETMDLALNLKPFRDSIGGLANKIESFGQFPRIKVVRKNDDRYLEFSASLFKKESTHISRFVSLRSEFENSFLIGDFSSAEIALERIKSELGESFWFIRSKILLLSYLGKNEELQQFSDSCKGRTNEEMVRFIINCLFMLSHSSQSVIHLKQLVIKNINELRVAGLSDYASMFALLFVPDPILGKYDQLPALSLIQTFPLVDQYCMFMAWVPRALESLDSDNPISVSRVGLHCFIETISATTNSQTLDTIKSKCIEKGEIINGCFTDIIENYECGEYHKILDKSILDSDNPFALVNIKAKSIALQGGNNIFDESPLSVITENLAKVYSLCQGQRQVKDNLLSFAVRLNGIEKAIALQSAIMMAAPLTFSTKDRKEISRLATTITKSCTPLIVSMANGGGGVVETEYISTENENWPDHRKIKYRILQLIKNGASDTEVQQELLAFQGVAPLQKDWIELSVEYFISIDDYENAMKVSAEALANNPECYACLPMNVLANYISNNMICSLEAVVIVFYFVKYISTKSDALLNEVFEEYIISNDVEFPSELLGEIAVLNSMERVFYRDICSPEIIDFLGCFSRSTGPKEERLRIINVLQDKDVISDDAARKEIEDIIGGMAIDAGVSEFHGGKVFVSNAQVAKITSDEVKSLFGLYKFSKNSTSSDYLVLNDGEDDKGVAIALVAGDKNNILLKMVNTVTHVFLFDESHGLDKNLSTEIRHGFFSNLMRSRPEKRYLLSEIGSDDQYQKINYWFETNPLVVNEVLEKADEYLRWFSAQFHNLLLAAEEWMKIELDDADNGRRCFNFTIFSEEFEFLKRLVDSADHCDDFIDGLFEILWEKTKTGLEKTKEKLNGEFRSSVDILFDQLIARIEDVTGGGNVLGDLSKAIIQTKSDIREDITMATEWFNICQARTPSDQSLDLLIDVSVRYFDTIKGKRSNIRIDLSHGISDIKVNGLAIKPFVVSFINILDNCFRHSGFGGTVQIEIEGSITEAGWIVEIKNPVSSEKSKNLTVESIKNTSERMRDPDSSWLMRTEGDSGLYKILNNLKSISSQIDVSIDWDGHTFTTSVSCDGNTIC
nr:hypothetical protein [uncultured Pseudogulbenkiania sp.]